MTLDYSVVHTSDGRTHARVRGAPVLLCGIPVPLDAFEDLSGRDYDCGNCRSEAEARDEDRAIGVVDA